MKYYQVQEGEWQYPKRKGYKMACCDCGLVHNLDFKLLKEGKKRNKILFRAYRNNRATGQMRKKK